MAGADHPAKEDQDELEIDGALRELALHQPYRHQQIGPHCRSKEFEGLLNPDSELDRVYAAPGRTARISGIALGRWVPRRPVFG